MTAIDSERNNEGPQAVHCGPFYVLSVALLCRMRCALRFRRRRPYPVQQRLVSIISRVARQCRPRAFQRFLGLSDFIDPTAGFASRDKIRLPPDLICRTTQRMAFA